MSGRARTSSALAAASLLAGILAYVLFAVLTRRLGSAGAAPVSVLWTWWGLSSAALSFPVQHWIVQLVTRHDGFAVVRRAMPTLAACAAALAGLAGFGSWLVRDPLFRQDGPTFPALFAALTAGSVLMGVLRGVLAARSRFGGLASTLVGEHVARVVPVVVLAAADVRDPAAYGLVLVLGSYVGLIWPPLLALPRSGDPAARASFRQLGSAASSQLIAQVVLTSGPIVLALRGGAPAEVTALFVTLAVFRAPLIVAQGLVSGLTARWTTLTAGGHDREVRRIRLGLLGVAFIGSASAAGAGAWLGPPVIRLVFGEAVEVAPSVAAVVASGSMLAVGNVAAMVLAIAMASVGRTVVAWLAALGVGALVVLLTDDATSGTATAFAVAEAVAFLVLSLHLRARTTGRAIDVSGAPTAP